MTVSSTCRAPRFIQLGMNEEKGLLTLLHRLEKAFLDDLVPRLRDAANGHDAWIFVRETTAAQLGLSSRHAATAEALALQTEEITVLYKDLSPENPASPASRYLYFCDIAADPDHAENKGPHIMAQSLLREIIRQWPELNRL
jgi:hypothetical protein